MSLIGIFLLLGGFWAAMTVDTTEESWLFILVMCLGIFICAR